MARPHLRHRLDVIYFALQGVGLPPSRLELTRKAHAELTPAFNHLDGLQPVGYRGVSIDVVQGRSGFLVALGAGRMSRAPLKLRRFAEWLAINRPMTPPPAPPDPPGPGEPVAMAKVA